VILLIWWVTELLFIRWGQRAVFHLVGQGNIVHLEGRLFSLIVYARQQTTVCFLHSTVISVHTRKDPASTAVGKPYSADCTTSREGDGPHLIASHVLHGGQIKQAGIVQPKCDDFVVNVLNRNSGNATVTALHLPNSMRMDLQT
jgi:hypothetical protein